MPAQIAKFIGSGLTQLVFDWSVFSVVYALSGETLGANFLGRISGACLGYWLNGRFTFAAENSHRLGRVQFTKFAVVWILLTLVSTGALYAAEHNLRWANVYVVKAIVEATLAVISFAVSKLWVYR